MMHGDRDRQPTKNLLKKERANVEFSKWMKHKSGTDNIMSHKKKKTYIITKGKIDAWTQRCKHFSSLRKRRQVLIRKGENMKSGKFNTRDKKKQQHNVKTKKEK